MVRSGHKNLNKMKEVGGFSCFSKLTLVALTYSASIPNSLKRAEYYQGDA